MLSEKEWLKRQQGVYQTQVGSRFIDSTIGELIGMIVKLEKEVQEHENGYKDLFRAIAKLEVKLENK